MNDIFSRGVSASRPLGDFHLKRMLLSPRHWESYKLPIKLDWSVVRFNPDNKNEVADKQIGVYSFLVQPGIANHPCCSYLLYIGMTERQNFRERYDQYLREWRAGEASRRVHVTEMLEKWEGFLYFAYAPIHDKKNIVPVENALLSAYLPPTNKDLPASVNREVRRLFST